jgi:hypothetical protein
MTSYVGNEGDLQNPDGINTASLSSFLTVSDGQSSKAKDVKINILVPLYDRLDVHKIKVVAMIKGEFQSKVIDAEGANGKLLVLCLRSIGILILVKSKRETNILLASQLMS